MSIIKKHIKYGKNKHNRMCSSLYIHTKTACVTTLGNLTVMSYWNDIVGSFFLLHIRANFGIMLARDYTSCQAARCTLVYSKQRAKTQMACKKPGFKSYWPLVGPIETFYAQPLQLNRWELTFVIHQMCASIPQQYIDIDTFYQWVHSTVL